MSNYRKKDLIELVSGKTGNTQSEVKVILEEMLNSIAISLQKQDKVEIRGFGTFSVNLKKDTPQNAPQAKPVFVVSNKLTSHINNTPN